MVRGISRRVIVVRAENSAVFEQAFFIVRDGAAPTRQALREACAVAERYVTGHRRRRVSTRAQLAAGVGLGAVLSSLFWAAALWLL